MAATSAGWETSALMGTAPTPRAETSPATPRARSRSTSFTTTATATSEALLVALKFGLDGARMADIWNASTGRSNTTENKLHQHILNKKFAAGFTLKLLDKDVKIARALAERLEVRADYLDRVSALLGDALEELGDEADHTALYRYLEKISEGREA